MKGLRLITATAVFAVLMLALGMGFRHSAAGLPQGVSFARAFVSFALLFAPLWFFGFLSVEPLKRRSRWTRIGIAGFLALPYFVFAAGTTSFSWRAAVIVVAFPILLAAFLEIPSLPSRMTWRDAAAITLIVAAYFLRWLQGAWPDPALALFTKLFLADVALYCFLVIRRLDGGYSLIPSASALKVGLREWAFYVPVALALGELTGFIHFHAVIPAMRTVLLGVLSTFLLVAIPEELFFRAILQNLLETRFGRGAALITASVLFGLSHFHHGAAFNWRYVLLASIAGFFYGRAWLANRHILAAVVTHTAVDVVWSLWFK